MSSHKLFEIIRRPLMTEKNTHRTEVSNQYSFEVDSRANKVEIRSAIEALFKVRVTNVRTVNVKGKLKRHGMNMHRTADVKKAIVSLAEGEKIELI